MARTTGRDREYRRELAIAREIQLGFLPERIPARAGWQWATRYRPAREVSGDFYDGFELINGRRVGFVIADVCDKGVGAALFMALVRTLLRHTAEHAGSWSPVEDGGADLGWELDEHGVRLSDPMLFVGAGPLLQAMIGTNRYLAENHIAQGYFATVFFGSIDPATGCLLYVNAGHNAPVVVRAGGERFTLGPTGPALGISPASTFALTHVLLEPGDSVFLYTDGVTEARDAAGAFLTAGAMTEVLTAPVRSAEDLIERVDRRLLRHVAGAEQFDDITMMAIHRLAGR
jgi:phosphoserine phosphatase RsbU/P